METIGIIIASLFFIGAGNHIDKKHRDFESRIKDLENSLNSYEQ